MMVKGLKCETGACQRVDEAVTVKQNEVRKDIMSLSLYLWSAW